jgi:hypothetical protein
MNVASPRQVAESSVQNRLYRQYKSLQNLWPEIFWPEKTGRSTNLPWPGKLVDLPVYFKILSGRQTGYCGSPRPACSSVAQRLVLASDVSW